MARRSVRSDLEELSRRIDEVSGSIDGVKVDLARLEKLVDSAVASFAQTLRDASKESRALVDDAIARVVLNEVGRRMNRLEAIVASTTAELRASANVNESHSDGGGLQLPDGFYSALEEKFRGDVDDISTRQAKYARRVTDSPSSGRFVDLGCGRGEFLTILRNHDIEAVGVDFDPWSAEQLRSAGHECVVADALAYLRTLPGSSIRGASLLQVIEHIEMPRLVAILGELRRVISPGGLVILETPNGANLKVAASTFWIDPSHIHPMLPEFVAFLLEFSGFEIESVETSAPTAYEWELNPRPEGSPNQELRDAVIGLQRLVVGHQDVTVIAVVPDT